MFKVDKEICVCVGLSIYITLFPSKLAIKGFFECPRDVTFLFKVFFVAVLLFFCQSRCPLGRSNKETPILYSIFFFRMFDRPKRPKKTCRRHTYKSVIA